MTGAEVPDFGRVFRCWEQAGRLFLRCGLDGWGGGSIFKALMVVSRRGGIGRRAGFRFLFLRECPFDPGRRYFLDRFLDGSEFAARP